MSLSIFFRSYRKREDVSITGRRLSGYGRESQGRCTASSFLLVGPGSRECPGLSFLEARKGNQDPIGTVTKVFMSAFAFLNGYEKEQGSAVAHAL